MKVMSNKPKNNVKPMICRYLSEIGRKGGLVKSDAKARAVRENGLKGGRPKTRLARARSSLGLTERCLHRERTSV